MQTADDNSLQRDIHHLVYEQTSQEQQEATWPLESVPPVNEIMIALMLASSHSNPSTVAFHLFVYQEIATSA